MPVTGWMLRDMLVCLLDASATASRIDSRRNARLRHPTRSAGISRACPSTSTATPRRRCPAPRAAAAALRRSARCRRSPRRRTGARRANRRLRPSSRCSVRAAGASRAPAPASSARRLAGAAAAGAAACGACRGGRAGRLPRQASRPAGGARHGRGGDGAAALRRRGGARLVIARLRTRQHPPDGERQHQRAAQTHQRRHQPARIRAPLGLRHLREIGRRRARFARACRRSTSSTPGSPTKSA